MESPHICHKYNKPIRIINEIKKDNKFYHKKCINQGYEPNNKEEENKKFTH